MLAGALPWSAEVATPGQDVVVLSEEDLAEARGLLDRALNGSPVVRPQAASRFATLGAPARAVLEQAASEPGGLEALGPDVLANVGTLLEGELRQLARSSAIDLEFPWRPALLGGLAESAREADAATFAAALTDPLSAARTASLVGLGALNHRGSAAKVRAALADRDGAVRLEAALVLDAFGHPGALATALEELRRADTFFEIPTGAQARRLASRRLTERLKDTEAEQLFGFAARELPTQGPNPEALAALEAFLHERARDDWPSQLPAHVRAGGTEVSGPLGLELRSCRAGELQLALTEDDVLLVGSGTPARVELPGGTVRALVQRMAELPGRLGDDVFGRPGCDLERFRLSLPGDTQPLSVHVLKGSAPVQNLRPGALDELAAAWLDLVPETGDDPRLRDLRARLAALFDSVGGKP